LLNTAGQVNSVTVGAFTVSDSEALGGSGCNGIMLTGPATTTGYAWSVTSGAALTDNTTTNTKSVTDDGANVPLQAVTDSGSSMITGILGDDDFTTTNTPAGLTPCIDVGGVSGT